MRYFLFTVSFMLLCLASYAQFPVSATEDVQSNSVDATNSAEKQAEQVTQENVLELTKKWAERVEMVMDSVNEVMNAAGAFIATAREVEKAGEDVASIMTLYRNIVPDIKDNALLTPSQRIMYLNMIFDEVENMQKNYMKITALAGKQGVANSIAGRMNDGSRIKLIRRYAAYVSQTCASLRNIYSLAVGKGASNAYDKAISFGAMSAIGGF